MDLLLYTLKNRYFRFLLNRICPKPIFNYLHRWPGGSFFWTDKKVSFTLSFDCDNPEDHECLPWLISILKKYQINASFAVVGEVVSKNIEAYAQIVDSGHEIINHGYSIHQYSDENGNKHPSMFYETLKTDEITNEIEKNDQFLKDQLGTKPIGFRTPHFGTFQNREQLTLIHKIIKEKSYQYSSSSTIFEAKFNNFVGMSKSRIWEFPLSSIPNYPLTVFDSWNILSSPDSRFKKEEFNTLFSTMLRYAFESEECIFLNLYFDPLHILKFQGFKNLLENVVKYKDLIWVGPYCDIMKSAPLHIL